MNKWENIVTIPQVLLSFCLLEDGATLNNQKISDFIGSDPFLNSLLLSILHKQSEKLTIESALNSYGHKGLRDKIASLYLYKLEMNHYPDSFEQDYALDLIDFEKRFSEFEAGGVYRGYALAYFLKVYNEYEFNHGGEEVIPSVEVDEILTTGKIRSNRLDWLILTLTLCLSELSKDEILRNINKEQRDVYSLLSLLSEKKQEKAFSTMLLYAHSINETEIFSFKRV